ncbi:uncharacterized protein N7511_002249 [Penicillium nucicola]|uniref:uncharacterized protein n=1 Tax=Penicillium nucicola TaxID=1850975 RepID=UPI00254591C8|nr:uncharacterized protein N7511_002249 [Penicillium nucicola]KAJ5770198.1 hypothetical protein N7511_002249 [Penicillium nucicola]
MSVRQVGTETFPENKMGTILDQSEEDDSDGPDKAMFVPLPCDLAVLLVCPCLYWSLKREDHWTIGFVIRIQLSAGSPMGFIVAKLKPVWRNMRGSDGNGILERYARFRG